jgi:cell division transport system permease protein
MSGVLNRLMPIPDFAFSRDASTRYLPWIIGGLSFLAALLLFAAISMQAQLRANRTDMAHLLTIHVPANLDVPQDVLMDHVKDTLKNDPRVLQMEPVTRAELSTLISPWLGEAASSEALPLPAVLEVRLHSESGDPASLIADLQKLHPHLRVQSYGDWLEDYLATLRLMQTAACALAGLLLMVGACVITFAAHMSLMVHQPAVHLLHSFGATSGYITRQFQWHAAQVSLRGAVPGTLIAAALYAAFGMYIQRDVADTLLPDLRLTFWHSITLLLLLIAITYLARRASRHAILQDLSSGIYRTASA